MSHSVDTCCAVRSAACFGMGTDIHSRSEPDILEETRRAEALAETRRLLAESEQMLADAQRLTKTGSWVIDPIGGGASASAEGYRILCLPGKTVSAHYMECLTNVNPDDLPAVLRPPGARQ